jgi:hypothetical protein
VLDIDRNPQAGVAWHGAGLQQLWQEVVKDARFQDSDSQREAKRFGSALGGLPLLNPAIAVSVAPAPTLQEEPTSSAAFVRAAKRLSEGLEEQGYPGPADSLLRASKAVEKSTYLGGANLQAVKEVLTRAEKMPALAEDAAALRIAGRSMQEAQRSVMPGPASPSQQAEGPER